MSELGTVMLIFCSPLYMVAALRAAQGCRAVGWALLGVGLAVVGRWMEGTASTRPAWDELLVSHAVVAAGVVAAGRWLRARDKARAGAADGASD